MRAKGCQKQGGASAEWSGGHGLGHGLMGILGYWAVVRVKGRVEGSQPTVVPAPVCRASDWWSWSGRGRVV